jgi:hypothetical protein
VATDSRKLCLILRSGIFAASRRMAAHNQPMVRDAALLTIRVDLGTGLTIVLSS